MHVTTARTIPKVRPSKAKGSRQCEALMKLKLWPLLALIWSDGLTSVGRKAKLELLTIICCLIIYLLLSMRSPLEVSQGAATLGWSLRRYLERLRDAGLGSLPGNNNSPLPVVPDHRLGITSLIGR